MTVHGEWLDQAKRDLEVARHLADPGHPYYEWACFAAQQSAEKAVMALRICLGTDIRTLKIHPVKELLASVPDMLPSNVKQANLSLASAFQLDLHEQAARYPGLHRQPVTAPCKTYTAQTATDLIKVAADIVAFCDGLVPQVESFWRDLP